ncbi:MAG TPA: hypothetical protein VL485_27600, partial [Ktedonobacteraceae bacterium]|nr:hypothetical protein [Ktedonobacteraceae bacterium]
MTAALDKLQPGAYSITVTWTLHGDDPNLAIAVVANHGGATTNGSQIAMKDIKGAVDHLSQKTYYDVYLNSWNSTNRVSDDKFTTTTAGASHNSVMKERIPADGSSDPQLQSLAAATLSNQKLFDLLVFEGTFIGHYTRRGASGGWTRVDRLVLPAGQQIPESAISHIQSFTALEHLNALALTEPANSLVTFEYNPGTGDHDPIPVHVDGGTPNGIPALVQTDQELFHLLVPLLDPKGIQRIAHLVHPNKT